MSQNLEQVKGNHTRHGGESESGTQALTQVELQAFTVTRQTRALTDNLMEKVVDRTNLNRAYRRVRANKGSPGIDGMTTMDMKPWLMNNKDDLINQLLTGEYQPQEVLGVEIPKPGGGKRQLGIPTVIDRLVQQAILQILERLFDNTFSKSSYGFRPGRSAHQALLQASEYVGDDRNIVVDIDLEKFFDRVNHDILMSRLARRIADKRLLKIVRRFLESGMMRQGVSVSRFEGTPQGGPLSPLMSNIILDDLDKELEKRGHKFCRYADDCNVYVRTKKAGNRVIKSVIKFLEVKLKLKINNTKSAVAKVWSRKFLGYTIGRGGMLLLAKESLRRLKQTIRNITKIRKGVSLEEVVLELNGRCRGWIQYFRYARMTTTLQGVDSWIRRRLRCIKLYQLKRVYTTAQFLIKRKVKASSAWNMALSGKGRWRKSGTPQMHQAMNNGWVKAELKLMSLRDRYSLLQN